jgi:hypothetical protein
MRLILIALMLAALALAQSGCATGFRASGRDAGVGGGATLKTEPPVYLPPEK